MNNDEVNAFVNDIIENKCSREMMRCIIKHIYNQGVQDGYEDHYNMYEAGYKDGLDHTQWIENHG